MKAYVAVLAILLVAGVAYAWQPWKTDAPIRPPSGAYVPSGPNARALLWAVGDGADGGRRARSVVSRMRHKRFDRFLYLGDVYGSGLLSTALGDGSAEDYRARYDPIYGAFAAKTAPTPGNHEWPRREDGYDPYWRDVYGRLPPAYYSFRVAGWQLLSLNTEVPQGTETAQVRWLRARVRGPGTCRLAFWHRPRYSAGRHGDAPELAPLWNTLRGRAAIAVTAHDHNMQRFKPIDGIVQYVSGAGGHGLYALKRDRRLAFGNARAYGALRIELRPGWARMVFVSAGGKILDTSVVRCRRG